MSFSQGEFSGTCRKAENVAAMYNVPPDRGEYGAGAGPGRQGMTDELSELRRRIDECDAELVRWITERLRICQEVGRFKGERGAEIRVPEREEEVISKVLGLNEGPCPPETLEKIFRLLIDTAVQLEVPEAPAPPKE